MSASSFVMCSDSVKFQGYVFLSIFANPPYLSSYEAVKTEKLKDKIQKTLEREPDEILKITDATGNIFVLHLEFQTADDDEMIHRMLEYFAILYRLYKIPVVQYVFYLGEKSTKMVSGYSSPKMNFEYELIQVKDIPFELFMTSDKPEEIIFGILSNIDKKNVIQITETIVERIKETSASPLVFEKHIRQLRILSKLRKLQLPTDRIMESILDFIFIDKENDPLFVKGIEQGIEQGIENRDRDLVTHLIVNKKMTDEQIADLTNISPDFIVMVRQHINT